MKKKLISALILPCFLLWLLMVTWVFYNGRQIDYGAYYRASLDILQGKPIYDELDGIVYLYPPLLAQIWSGVTRTVTPETALWIWHGLNVTLLLMTLILLQRSLVNLDLGRVLVMLTLLFTPIIESFWIGQVSIMMLFFIVAAWAFAKRNHPLWAGLMLAFATWLKIYPIFLIFYFMWRRDWAVVRGAFLAGIALLLIQLAQAQNLADYFLRLLPKLALEGQASAYKSLSILGFTTRLFQEGTNYTPLIHAPIWIPFVRWVLTALMLGISIWVLTRHTPAKNSQATNKSSQIASFDMAYCLVLVGAMLFGATLWTSGLAPLLLPFVLLLTQALALWQKALLWLSYLLLTFYLPFIMARPINSMQTWTVLSFGFLGILLLWSLLLSCVATQPVVAQAENLSSSSN